MKNGERGSMIDYVCEPRIELCSNTKCTVEGIKEIPVCAEDNIKIDLGKTSVSFFGDGLFISSFSREGAVIEGTIVSLEFDGNA